MPIEFALADRGSTPPGGYVHVVPETGVRFSHYSRDAFFNEIMRYRLGNGLPITPDWQEAIEDELCRQHPEWIAAEICKRTESVGTIRPINLGALQSFFNVAASWVAGIAGGGEPFVSEEEAHRRARICITCQYNLRNTPGCAACADKLLHGITKVVGGKSTAYDRMLGACGICSCALPVAIWIPLAPQHAGLTDEQKAQFKGVNWCWKRIGLE